MTSKPRSILITGASTGIGEACALRLAKSGFHVFAGVRRLQDGSALMHKTGDCLTPVLLDVTDASTIAAAREIVEAQTGEQGLAGLINNAGVVAPGPLEFLPEHEIRNQIEVNLFGCIVVTQAFVSLVRRARGRIINIGSVQSRIGVPFLSIYSATKFALAGFSRALRLELRPWGIKVILIEPGSVSTKVSEKGPEALERIRSALPNGAKDLYARHYTAFKGMIQRMHAVAIAPEVVAKVVEQALITRNPKPRYLVGRDAAFFGRLALLSERVSDWIIASAFRL